MRQPSTVRQRMKILAKDLKDAGLTKEQARAVLSARFPGKATTIESVLKEVYAQPKSRSWFNNLAP